LAPEQPLLVPVQNPGDSLELAQLHTVAAVRRLGQEQDVFLYIRSQV
jgi:hypothetical protein